MATFNWLSGFKRSFITLRGRKRGNRITVRRAEIASFSTQIEVLEQRAVMDAAAVAAAQSALSLAESALQSQIGLFIGQEGVLAGNRQSALNTAAANYTSSVLAANTAFDTSKQILEGLLETTLDGFQTTFNGALAGLTTIRDAAFTTADVNFNLSALIEDGIFAVQRALANFIYTSAQATADSTLQGQEVTAKGVYDGALTLADSSFDGSILSENTAYQSAVNAAKSFYNLIEPLLWNIYQAAFLPLPGSPETLFQTNVAAAAALRDATVTLFPNVNLDQYVMMPSSGLQSALQTAYGAYQSDVDLAGTNFENDSNSDLDDFTNAISGPGGATSAYESQLATALTNWDLAKTTAESVFSGAMDTAKANYQTDVYGPSGAYPNLLSALATAKSGFDTMMGIAQSAYDTIVNPAKAMRDTSVSTTTQNFQTWMQTTRNSLTSQYNTRRNQFLGQYDTHEAAYQTAITIAEGVYNTALQTAETTFTNLVDGTTPLGYRPTLNGVIQVANSTYSLDQQTATDTYNTTVTPIYAAMMTAMMAGLPFDPTPLYQAAKDYQEDIAEADITFTQTVGPASVTFVSSVATAQTTREQKVRSQPRTILASPTSTSGQRN